MPQIDRLEEAMDVASAPIAFKGKGEAQWAFCFAADYADEWPIVRRADGSIK